MLPAKKHSADFRGEVHEVLISTVSVTILCDQILQEIAEAPMDI